MNISRAIVQSNVLTFITLALLIGCADNEEKDPTKNINRDALKVSSEILSRAPQTKKAFFVVSNYTP